jgi:chemotaxis protein histidine kinase CheA
MTIANDPALLEMFRAEKEVHLATLSDGLLALENNPGAGEPMEGLMRAAHSLKGAAKIMGLSAAVDVAHVIEDCFVAARAGRVRMSSRLVDVLLRGVDLLDRVADVDSVGAATPDTEAAVRDFAAGLAQATQAGTGVAGVAGVPMPTAQSQTGHEQLLRLPRAVDAAWVRRHHAEALRCRGGARGELCLDFSAVETIDPVGLAWLSLAARVASGSGQDSHRGLHAAGVSPGLAQLLSAVGLPVSSGEAWAGGWDGDAARE